MIGGVLVVFGLTIVADRFWMPVADPADTAAQLSRFTYDELYQLDWRRTDQTGNVSVEATYFSPSLQSALTAIDSPSAHQQAMQRVLADIPTDAVVYYVVIAQPDPFFGAVDAPATVIFNGAEQTAAWEELDPLLLPQTDFAQRDGFFWVASSNQPAASQLSITYPAGSVHRFAWNNLLNQ